MKADAVWSEIVILYLFASHSEASACLNAHAPSAYLARKVNNPVFTPDRGFAGDGTGAFLETDFADNTAGTKWLADSAFMGIWMNTAPDGRVLGVNGTTASFISQVANESGSARLHGTNGLSFPSDNGLGFSAVNRDPTGLQTYRQSSRLGQHANTTAAVAAGTHQVFRSSAGVFGAGRAPAVIYAGKLTDAQEAALYNRLNTYLTAIGAA